MKLHCIGLLALLATCNVAGAVEFATNPLLMRFAIVRSLDGCEPTCPEWIAAEGAIQSNTPALFRKVLRLLKGRKLPIIVNSPGGDVNAAMELGRIIRKNKLDIAVGKTYCLGEKWPGSVCFSPVEGLIEGALGAPLASEATCNSACPLMFAGGIRRLVGPQATLGVHQVTTTHFRYKRRYQTTYQKVRGKRHRIVEAVDTFDRSYETYRMSKSLEKKIGAYLREMGIEKGVLATMKNTPANTIHPLVPQSMLRTKLVTSLDSYDLLTNARICDQDPKPENCRTAEVSLDAAK